MGLNNFNIIQINATIITGVLIFLTVGTNTLLGGNAFENEITNTLSQFIILAIILTMIIPFSVSALVMIDVSRMELFKEHMDNEKKKRKYKTSIYFMFIGFGYITLGIVIITIIRMITLFTGFTS